MFRAPEHRATSFSYLLEVLAIEIGAGQIGECSIVWQVWCTTTASVHGARNDERSMDARRKGFCHPANKEGENSVIRSKGKY